MLNWGPKIACVSCAVHNFPSSKDIARPVYNSKKKSAPLRINPISAPDHDIIRRRVTVYRLVIYRLVIPAQQKDHLMFHSLFH